jgi:hypothetical protein
LLVSMRAFECAAVIPTSIKKIRRTRKYEIAFAH